MPNINRKLEKVAFSLVVLSAVGSLVFIVWQKNPGITLAIQAGSETLMPHSEYLLGCMVPDQGVCERMLSDLKTADKT